MKKLLAIMMIFVMVFSMAACGGGGDSSSEEKTELVVMDSEWYGVDSFQLDSSSGGQTWVGASLFQWDPENSKVVDNICQDWTVAEDGKSVTFTVPEGATAYVTLPGETAGREYSPGTYTVSVKL